ncbi:MAG: ABC transporter ATP-binding protein/permease [Rhodovarius sp.]|nr:ABC transporter ATP-binding protein/permease [Rhodovarius sp.]
MTAKAEQGTPPHPNTLRQFLALSGPWLARWHTRGQIALLVLFTLIQVVFAVAYNIWFAMLFDALDARDTARIWQAIWLFVLLLAAIIVSNIAQIEWKRRLTLSWREALTERLLGQWLEGGQHWRLAQIPGSPDNPDARIAEDIRIATEHAVELFSTLVLCGGLLVSFVGILWSLSGEVKIGELALPGMLVWLALLYAGAGAVAAFLVGRPLTRATEARQRAEANFRFALAEAREKGEALAMARGEAQARSGLLRRFAGLAAAWREQSRGIRHLTGFQSAYTTVSPILPLMAAAPRYLAGDITLGQLIQIGQAFPQTVSALSWPVDNAARLAEWRASAERVLLFADALEPHGEASAIQRIEGGEALVLDQLILRDASGIALSAPLDAVLTPGTRIEIHGDGSAIRALQLAILGLWPWGEGRLEVPAGIALAALPANPWLPEGRLAALLDPTGETPEAALTAALEAVGLGRLAGQLEQEAAWGALLDDADRLRLGFARLLLGRPGLVLLGDLAGPLGEEEGRRLLRLLVMAAPEAIVLVADHGSSGFAGRLLLPPPEGVAPGAAARALSRARTFQLVDWLRRGFGHAAE